jgi:hypothetical protein
VARFRAHVDIRQDRVLIAIDSGTVHVPGEEIPGAPPLMSGLYLSAIVAVTDSSSLAVVGDTGRRRYAERRAWSPLATSDSALIRQELRYGETAAMPRIRVSVPGAFANDRRTLWLIFRITGNTVALMAPLTAGGPVQRRDLPGGVRVYACGDRDLSGRVDPDRAHILKRAYGMAC